MRRHRDQIDSRTAAPVDDFSRRIADHREAMDANPRASEPLGRPGGGRILVRGGWPARHTRGELVLAGKHPGRLDMEDEDLGAAKLGEFFCGAHHRFGGATPVGRDQDLPEREFSRGRGAEISAGRLPEGADEEDRDRAPADDLLGDAAQEPTGNAAAAVGADRDHCRAFGLGLLEDRVGDGAVGDPGMHLGLSGGKAQDKIVEVLLRLRALLVPQALGVNPLAGLHASDRLGQVEDPEEDDLRILPAENPGHLSQDHFRRGGTVQRNQYPFEHGLIPRPSGRRPSCPGPSRGSRLMVPELRPIPFQPLPRPWGSSSASSVSIRRREECNRRATASLSGTPVLRRGVLLDSEENYVAGGRPSGALEPLKGNGTRRALLRRGSPAARRGSGKKCASRRRGRRRP